MATLAITLPTESGAALRRMAMQLEAIASAIPDRNATGAAQVLTIDNAPGAGTATVQLTAGPVTTAVYSV